MKRMRRGLLAVGLVPFALFAVDRIGAPTCFEYEGELVQAVEPNGDACSFETPDGKCTGELRLSNVPTRPGELSVVDKATKKRQSTRLPKGLYGLTPAVKFLDGGRVMVAYVDPTRCDDKFYGFLQCAWIGPWASLKAGSARGFYTIRYGRPQAKGLWLPKDLSATDAKFRARLEGRAKGTGAWDSPLLVDLTTDLSRYSTIHESKFYDAHATSIMLPDEKTFYCFWDLAHGGPCGPAAKSTDGGRTWTDISDLIPAEFRRSLNAPVAFRFVDPRTGKGRLRVFAAHEGPRTPKDVALTNAMPSVMSEDEGKTWKYMPPMGADFTCGISFFGMVQRKDGSYLAVYQRHPNANGDNNAEQPATMSMIMSTVSRDGGLTWEKPNIVAESVDKFDLCEPAVFYSPDKSELCVLIRENTGKHPSQMCFSRDDGRTWSELRDAPLALWGHRHVVQKLHDGRYLVVFRLVDWYNPLVLGWVGPYEGIRDGTGRGGYLISLFPNYGCPFDCGYQGMHLKSDGEIVINTYTHFRPWGNATPSIVSLHFKIEEADALVAAQRAHWADQLKAIDEAKAGVEPDAAVLKATRDVQTVWAGFGDLARPETNLTVLTSPTIYGYVKRGDNPLSQMEHLPKHELKGHGCVDILFSTILHLEQRAWYEPPLAAFVKWTYESDRDGRRVLRLVNDFYGTVFVNGEQLPSTYDLDGSYKTGQTDSSYRTGLRYEVNLRKGKNEIVLLTSPGTTGHWLCGAALENE